MVGRQQLIQNWLGWSVGVSGEVVIEEDYVLRLSKSQADRVPLQNSEVLAQQGWKRYEEAYELRRDQVGDRFRERLLAARRGLTGVSAGTYEISFAEPSVQRVGKPGPNDPPVDRIVYRTTRDSFSG